MKTAAEYREMAEECFKWASEARTSAVRVSYLQLAQVWLNAASNIDGPSTDPQAASDRGRSNAHARRADHANNLTSS